MAGKTSEGTNMNGQASIDRTADLIDITDMSGPTSYVATPNFILGFSGGNPVSTTDTQTLTNKTLTAPAVSDPVLSGTITGTYTLGGTPTFPAAVVTLTGSQTLTNKTLTSPTINSPTITNPTLTVDTISEFTSANGVSIDGLLIKDGLLPAGNIQPLNLVSGTGSSWGWTSFTPTLTNLTIGNGTISAAYKQTGKAIVLRLIITLGSTSVVGTVVSTSLPVTSVAYSAFTPLGIASHFDTSASATNLGVLAYTNTTTAEITVANAAGTYAAQGGLTATVPFTWATGDRIHITASYEAA